MISRCANPTCSVGFDHRQGQLFRFPQKAKRPANTHSVQHFWLCSRCSSLYSLEYVESRGVALQSRFKEASRHFIAAA